MTSRTRPREVRAKTLSATRAPAREVTAIRMRLMQLEEDDPIDVDRPRTRGECADGPRPCPWTRCIHHLYLDVSEETGAVKLNFPDLEPDELKTSCSLDVADGGASTLEEVGALMNITRERVRQIQERALMKLSRALPPED